MLVDEPNGDSQLHNNTSQQVVHWLTLDKCDALYTRSYSEWPAGIKFLYTASSRPDTHPRLTFYTAAGFGRVETLLPGRRFIITPSQHVNNLRLSCDPENFHHPQAPSDSDGNTTNSTEDDDFCKNADDDDDDDDGMNPLYVGAGCATPPGAIGAVWVYYRICCQRRRKNQQNCDVGLCTQLISCC